MEEIVTRPKKSQKQRMAELIEQAKAHHLEATSALQNALLHAKLCGDVLNEIQPLIGFGRWKRWIKKQFTEKGSFSYETAAVYKRIADKWNNPAVLAAREQGIGSIKGLLGVIRENQTHTDMPVDNYSWMAEKEKADQLALKGWEDEMCTGIRTTFAARIKEFTFEELWILQSEARLCPFELWDTFRDKLKEVVKKELGYFPCENGSSPALTKQEERREKRFWKARAKEYKSRKLVEEAEIIWPVGIQWNIGEGRTVNETELAKVRETRQAENKQGETIAKQKVIEGIKHKRKKVVSIVR